MALTAKQQRFVEEYATDFNATQAAVRAGYSEKTAYSTGWENLRKPEIAEAIQNRLDELSMSAAEATKRLTDWGRGTPEPFLVFHEDGSFSVDLASERGRASLHLIKKLEQTERFIPAGEGEPPEVERKTKIELHDAKDAVVQLAKIHGLYIERKEITGKDGQPLFKVYEAIDADAV